MSSRFSAACPAPIGDGIMYMVSIGMVNMDLNARRSKPNTQVVITKTRLYYPNGGTIRAWAAQMPVQPYIMADLRYDELGDANMAAILIAKGAGLDEIEIPSEKKH